MKLVRKIQYVCPIVLLPLLFAVPALAQFEVNPDHFDNSPAKTSRKPAQKAKARTAQHSTSTAASASRASSTKVQSRSKTQSSAPDQHLNAKATPVPRE